jgi:hypothetical protein
MRLPDLLIPRTTQRITLPSGREVEVPKTNGIFRKWTRAVPNDTYGCKAILDYDGEMAFAELAILRIFEQAGWEGGWIDSYRRQYRVGYWGENVTKDLPPEQQAVFDGIRAKLGCRGGCFDVFCWREGVNAFAEAKRQSHDRIRRSQRRWLEGALDVGVPLESFLIVEWSVEDGHA